MKKLIKIIVFSYCAIFFQFAFAQKNDQAQVLNDESFEELKTEAIELYTSAEYIAYMDLGFKFAAKLPKDYCKTQEDFKTWIVSRIDQSKFNSVEEAISEYEIMYELHHKYEQLQKGIYKKRSALSDKYGSSLVTDLYNEKVSRKIIDIQLGR
ncbi:MAG: hypothetical protein RSH24_19165 [Flavobacterium sp.]